MSRDKRRLLDYLGHIQSAIERIGRYIHDLDEAGFFRNELIQDAVIRNIEIIGEASRNIGKHYSDFATDHPEIPFAFAYEMRNALSHGYFKVDLEVVWRTVENDLPQLRRQVERLAEQARDNLP